MIEKALIAGIYICIAIDHDSIIRKQHLKACQAELVHRETQVPATNELCMHQHMGSKFEVDFVPAQRKSDVHQYAVD